MSTETEDQLQQLAERQRLELEKLRDKLNDAKAQRSRREAELREYWHGHLGVLVWLKENEPEVFKRMQMEMFRNGV